MSKYISKVDARKAEEESYQLTLLVLKKLDDLDINKTELNHSCLKASHNYYRS